MKNDNRVSLPPLWKAPKGDKEPGKNSVPVCGFCGDTGHTSIGCFKKPRKPIPVRRKLNRVGKQGKRTAAAVTKWKRVQKPNHQGYFECYICHRWITYLEAEHVKSKARHPELRTDPNNFKPTCTECNEKKRSKDN